MALYKRGQVWGMSFVYRGKLFRKSTETDDRKLAKRIYDKVKGQIAEGKWFEVPLEEKTFGELLSLRWPLVDMTRKVMVILRPFTKNRKPKTVPLNDYAMEVLKNRPRSIKTDLVFYTSNHTQYRGRNVDRALSDALAKAGIKDFRFHDLRHTCATWLLHSGGDIYQVQRILGHKHGEITKRDAITPQKPSEARWTIWQSNLARKTLLTHRRQPIGVRRNVAKALPNVA